MEQNVYYSEYQKNSKDLKLINLALQGGGAHGAFTWGVIDKLLEDGRIHLEGISGTSAGSMIAVVLAYGLLQGGRQGARELLYEFWKAVSDAGMIYNPCKQFPWERFCYGNKMDNSILYQLFISMSHTFSPYQWNPMDINPVKDILANMIDFKRLRECPITRIFLSATNVRTGQVKVFHTKDVSVDATLASACLPNLYKSVEIDGEYYWDGGFSGNPSLYPFFYHVKSSDILIVHVNPIERPAPPELPADITNRVNEISFNSALLKEFRAIDFVHNLLEKGWIKDEFKSRFKYILLHSISADKVLNDLSVASKCSSDWDFLMLLFNRGRAKAEEWLGRHYEDLGKKSTVDLSQKLEKR